MTERRVRGILGLCQRAGALKTGQDTVEQMIKRGGAHLALIDSGTAPRGQKAIRDACAYAGVALRELPRDLLGEAIGKPGRMAACVTDAGFAKTLTELLSPKEGE